MEKAKTRSAKRVTKPKTLVAKVKAVLAKKAPASKKTMKPEDFLQLVQAKAYYLYESRGYVHGDDMADWLEAERLVKNELGIA